MKNFRQTYAEINLANITKNIDNLCEKHKNYAYHIAVVKANFYGHGLKTLSAITKTRVNYLACATLEEALEIRKKTALPILCLGVILPKDFKICVKNNITISACNLEQLRQIKNSSGLKAHVKINSGMNRLGVSNALELEQAVKILRENEIEIEGIYTHIADFKNKKRTKKQVARFLEITKNIDLQTIPIRHIGATDAINSFDFAGIFNGCRFGIGIYGLGKQGGLSTFRVVSRVVQINEVKGEFVGYGGKFFAKNKRVAVVPIGYADGILRNYTGGKIYINGKKYMVVGNICMDMLFILVDDGVKTGDEVEIIRDNAHILTIAKKLRTIPYEILCNISSRVPRLYKK